jgi:putative lumazine-binding protein
MRDEPAELKWSSRKPMRRLPMRRSWRRLFPTLALAAAVAATGAPARGSEGSTPGPDAGSDERAAIERLVTDYIRLYTRSTLDRWRELFHPALTVVSPGDDGAIRVRTLDPFFKAQKDRFETGRPVSERLENVRVDPGWRIARVSADFVFTDEGRSRRGTLGLHLARANDGWKIVAILFSYNPA